MTKIQFAYIAENFMDFAGTEVSYKEYIPWHYLTKSRKYRDSTGILAGVGLHDDELPNGECLVLRYPNNPSKSQLVHYKFIKFPKE